MNGKSGACREGAWTPEVSVIMGTCNEDRDEAAQAIDSILNQTYQNLELIICDDGSQESFYRWLEGYCRRDPRVRLFRNDKNQGLASALNRCLRHARGRYIARMDADDRSRADRLAKQAAFLDRHEEYALAGSSAYLVDGHGAWGMRRMEEQPDKESFLSTSPFIHPSVMVRREAMCRLHGYCESPKVLRAEDYDFFMRLYAAGYRGYNLQEPLLAYREDMHAYRKRKYRFRLNECRVRCQGFAMLGIRKGSLWYAVRPLMAGLVPAGFMAAARRRRFGRRVQKDDRNRHIEL